MEEIQPSCGSIVPPKLRTIWYGAIYLFHVPDFWTIVIQIILEPPSSNAILFHH
jgi:hypothetical protein